MKSTFSCWQSLAKKEKFLLQCIIFHHFNLQINSFHTKISHIEQTFKTHSLVTPVLTYCVKAWENTKPTNLLNIIKLQKRVVRILGNK